MSFEGLRGYAQAANDLSGIARARLAEAAREALRGEVERLGASLGLAGSEEVAKLRRTVERLERRVGALEVATGTGSAADRPPRRPSQARSRTGAPRPARPLGQGAPAQEARPGAVPEPGVVAGTTDPGTTDPGTTDPGTTDRGTTDLGAAAAAPTPPAPTPPAAAAVRTPVRRPRPAGPAGGPPDAADAPAAPLGAGEGAAGVPAP